MRDLVSELQNNNTQDCKVIEYSDGTPGPNSEYLRQNIGMKIR